MNYESAKSYLTPKQKEIIDFASRNGYVTFSEVTLFYNDEKYAKKVMVKLVRIGVFALDGDRFVLKTPDVQKTVSEVIL